MGEGIAYFTVESEPELARISGCAMESSTVGRIAIRVNPNVDPRTHKYNNTGEGGSKFGVSLRRAEAAFETASQLPGLEIVGLHMHLESVQQSYFGSRFAFFNFNLQIEMQVESQMKEDCHSPFEAHFEHLKIED